MFSPSPREVYALHLHLLACGAEIDDLFVLPAVNPDTGQKSAAVMWKDLDFEFTACAAPCTDWEAFKVEWMATLSAVNKMAPAERDKLVEGTVMRERLVEVLAAVQFKRRQHESTRRNG